eukprot:6964162-Alexandrium_andersonii.AAC.1
MSAGLSCARCTAAPGQSAPITQSTACGPPCAIASGSAITWRRRAGTTTGTPPRTGPTTDRGAWA